MNEQELSQLLHDAASDEAVSRTSSPRTLRRTRIRLAANSVLALSLIALVVGGGFTLANRAAVTGAPSIDPAGPITTPGPQKEFRSLTQRDEVILAEIPEGDMLWAFVADGVRRKAGPCLWAMTLTETITTRGGETRFDLSDASGVGDCIPLGVPESEHLGFYMWGADVGDRIEVLGQVSTDVSRLELQDSHDSDAGITIIEAPEELGRERNYFFLWLPMGEEGTLVAYDAAGRVLEEKRLCLEPGEPGASCAVAEDVRSTDKETLGAKAIEGYDQRLDCNKEESVSELGEREMGVVPKEALQEWLDKKSIYWIEPSDLDLERISPRAKELSLSSNGNGYRMVARTTLVPAQEVGDQHQGDSPSSSEIDQWRLAEVAYCPDLMSP